MGILGDVVEFSRSVTDGQQTPECKVDLGGGDAVTAGHFSAPGDDSPPLPSDVACLSDGTGTGAADIVGYQDPFTPPVAGPGEKRIYSRSAVGVVAVEVWLRTDGSLVLKNNLGSIELASSGDVTITTPSGIYGFATHTHPTPTGVSGPPVPGT
jgi:hypothetical protein